MRWNDYSAPSLVTSDDYKSKENKTKGIQKTLGKGYFMKEKKD